TLRDFNPGAAGKKAGEIAKQALNPGEGRGGVYDIIFDPLAFANLLGHILGFASAFSVDIGESFLADRIDKVIGNEIVTLVDDGSLAGGFNSSKFDAEGVPTQRNVVVEKGVLKTYLHNTSTAKKYGAESTGNAGLISPHPWNAVIEPGDYGRDDLFSGVNKGLYITNVWYTRFQNYRTGDFSTIPRDGLFLIENGELSQPLSNLRVSDNLLHILKNITALGDKQEWIHWWDAEVPSLLPYVLVKDVRVTKPED
ncbi:MAG: TldD/PmbA family protein, partial [Candidatus Altiarchaeota archaeon]|nr:TldD/PmbA family protein [Candidatus Altiarchaeota archaeon]